MKKCYGVILLILLLPIVLADIDVTKNVDFITASNVTYSTQTDLNFQRDIELSQDLLKADNVNSSIIGNATLYIISYNSSNVRLNTTGSTSFFSFSGVTSTLVFKYASSCYTVHSFTLPLSGYELLYTDTSCPAAPGGPTGGDTGGDTGAAAPATIINKENVTQNQTIEQIISEYYCNDKTFIQRVFSNCKIVNNGVCDDGETLLLDYDCNLGWTEIKSTVFMRMMWFLRFMMALSIILLMKDSKLFPVAAAVVIMIVIYNGAFMVPDYDTAKCTDVSYIMNAGYCIMPEKPVAGWGIAIAIFALIFSFLTAEAKPVKKKKPKSDEDDWRHNPLYPMLGALLLFYLIYSGTFIKGPYDTAKCTDVSYIMNAGHCIMPSNPVVGWIIGVAFVILILAYFDLEGRARTRKRLKTKSI